ncbi:hypothetical protein JOC34_000473 [Virgibacillus halotolerans]|uniref:hypothetical protein n=1 Tax=Virgibacillus halotolerans TaxID=1071053 RepID=UPI0019613942|nr:hypothetical protein [Virgibacillus halotolerans]MBM7598116.1 hypothetical protein [Virgibacillus halotolerans]
MFAFSKKHTLINGNWFTQGEYFYFKDGGGEKLLALYLNLQKFIRYDQFNFKSDLNYVTSIKQIYDSMNEYGRLVSIDDVYVLLSRLEELSVVKVTSHKNFKSKNKNSLYTKELLIINDLDYMKCSFYMSVPLDIIRYMLENGLTYRHVSLFLLMNKWTNNPEDKCFISVNKLAEWIGYSNKSVLKYYADMNKLGVMASYLKKDNKGHTKYEHFLLRDMDDIDSFKKSNYTAMNKFRE